MHDRVIGLFVNRYAFGRAVYTWPSPLLEHSLAGDAPTLPALKYPRVRYMALDDLICKKPEEEVNSEVEGGEHSHKACALTCRK